MSDIDWRKYKNFQKYEFDCKHTGENKMRPEFLDILQQIRTTYQKPMEITSGFRHWTHPEEIKKDKPGAHTYGVAADIQCYGQEAMDLQVIAYGYGIRRIGLHQRGPVDGRFLHIDMADKLAGFPSALWTY